MQKEGEDAAPAFALLGALEGLEFGRVDPMFRLPAGQKAGGKEPPSGETGLKAFALAAVDTLKNGGTPVQTAIYMVAEELDFEPTALGNLRKKMNVERSKPANERERSKPANKRKQHVYLIKDYEAEMLRMNGMSNEEIWVNLARISSLLGIQ